jgi:glutamate racemase
MRALFDEPASMSPAPILIFDSGVGGLSIHAAVAARLPRQRYVYACDNAAFPYGPKPEDELIERVHAVLDALIARYSPQLLVVACNTASTVALPRLRQHYSSSSYGLPIVGVVPAIKPAAALSQNRVIGLLATPGTVRRAYTDQLIRDFAGDCTVVRVGSAELVQIAERKLREGHVDIAALRELMMPFFAHIPPVDTVVLGCTHFPLLRDELQLAAPRPVHWVDSGAAIAARVENQLVERAVSAAANHVAAFTRRDSEANALRPALHARGFTAVEFLDM